MVGQKSSKPFSTRILSHRSPTPNSKRLTSQRRPQGKAPHLITNSNCVFNGERSSHVAIKRCAPNFTVGIEWIVYSCDAHMQQTQHVQLLCDMYNYNIRAAAPISIHPYFKTNWWPSEHTCFMLEVVYLVSIRQGINAFLVLKSATWSQVSHKNYDLVLP